MKSKRIFVSIFLCIALLAAAFLSACNQDGPEDTPKTEFKGFNVKETATAEAASEYFFETPEVTCNGKAVDVSISVKFGNTTIAHDGIKFYIEKEGTYKVTYTAALNGYSESKTTTVNAVYTSGPIIVSYLPTVLRYNTSIDVLQYITVKGLYEGEIESVTAKDVTSEDDSELSETQFDKNNNVLRITNEDIKVVRLIFSAKDIKGNRSQKAFDITMQSISWFGSYDFSGYAAGATSIAGLTVDFGANAENTSIEIVEDGGEKALKIRATTTQINNLIKITFDCGLIGEFGSFDSIDVDMKLTASENGGNGGLGYEFYYPEGVNNIFKASNGLWKTFAFSRADSLVAVRKNNEMQFQIKPWAAQDVEIYFRKFTGRYNTIVYEEEGTSFDLTELLRLPQSDFTAEFIQADGTELEVSDINAFIPQSSGTLKVIITKDGYYTTEKTIAVKQLIKPNFGQFDFTDKTIYTSISAHDDIKVDGYDAITSTMTGIYPMFAISSPLFKDLAKFDYFTVKYKLTYSSGSGVIGIKGTTGDVYNYPSVTKTADGWTLSTWRRDREGTGIAVWNYIEQNGIIQFQIYAFNGGSGATTTLTIAEIAGGYDDIVYDGTAINLLDKTGLTETEFSAIFTPAGGNAAVVSDIAQFIPSSSGELKLTINKSGYRTTEIIIGVSVV